MYWLPYLRAPEGNRRLKLEFSIKKTILPVGTTVVAIENLWVPTETWYFREEICSSREKIFLFEKTKLELHYPHRNFFLPIGTRNFSLAYDCSHEKYWFLPFRNVNFSFKRLYLQLCWNRHICFFNPQYTLTTSGKDFEYLFA